MNKQFTNSRLKSLDALRGFDMFWIMGAEQFFHQMSSIHPTSFWKSLAIQFNHPAWHGFAFYDLIFPLFLFLAGVATPFSIGKLLNKGVDKKTLLFKIVKRTVLLILLGIIYNNGLVFKTLDELRIVSVLGRIGLAYCFANIIYLYSPKKIQYILFAVFLLGYWAILAFAAAPGFESGNLTMEGNIVSYLDTLIVPGKLYLIIHDPEGLISTIPAISTALLGIFIGELLLSNQTINRLSKTQNILLLGLILVLLSFAWNLVLPINKNLWTSSFVLLCGGLSMLLLALFYWVIDVKGYHKWAFFFQVIGMNSILIYMSGTFIDWSFTSQAAFSWLGDLIGEPYQPVVMVVAYLTVQWLVLYLLYRQKLFLKV